MGSETTDQAVTPCGDVEGSGTIVVWEVLGGVAVGESFARLVDQFHAEQTSIRIERRNFEGGSEEMLETLAATDPAEWPDIVIAQPQALRRLIDSGRIVPPSVCGDVEQTMGPMLPVVRGAFSFDDQLRAVPFGISTPILLFDAAEFRAAGLDPASPPRTLEDLASASRQIVDSQASPYGLVVYDWFGNFLINQGAAQRGDVVVQPDNGRSNGPATVDFQMEIVGGGWDDYLAFYVDGVKQSDTYGDAVAAQAALTNSGTHLLMWEFMKGTGKAVLRKLPQ